MNNKLGIQDLASALAERYGMDQKSAQTFVKTVFEIVEEYVAIDKLVKIKGFGTFKLTNVSDRESINVNTGERIVIAGHTKLSFTPDSALKDAVNLPFSDFETTPLNETTSVEEMERIPSTEEEPQTKEESGINEAEESIIEVVEESVYEEPAPNVVGIEATETQTGPREESEPEPQPESVVEVSQDDSEELETKQLPEQPEEEDDVAEVEHEEEKEKVTVVTPRTETPSAHRPNDENPNYPMASDIDVQSGTSESNSRYTWLYTIFTISLMALSYVAGHYRVLDMVDISVYPETESPETQKTVVPEQKEKPVSAPVETIAKDSLSAATATKDSVVKTPVAAKPQQVSAPQEDPAEVAKYYPQVRGGEYWIVGDAGYVHHMQVGETLYRIARKELGSQDLVQYLIVFNKFEDPNVIHTGDPIRIPKLVKKADKDLPNDDI